MTHQEALKAVIICALITYALRAVPFVLFGGKRQMPAFLKRLSTLLPPAVMAVLVVYGLKDVSTFTSLHQWIPSLLGCGTVMALHLWKHNTILSVFLGTAVYIAALYLL